MHRVEQRFEEKMRWELEASFNVQAHGTSVHESEVQKMSHESEYTKGYKRGLKGEGSCSSWGELIGDSTVNQTGSYEARRAGYEAGLRDRARDQARNKGKK